MTTFDNIQHLWNQQNDSKTYPSQVEELIVLAEKKTRYITTKQYWTIGILGASALFFLWYMFVYVKFSAGWFHIGLSLMLFSLLLRLVVEFFSYRNLQRIDVRTDLTNYTKSITGFYHSRKKIHYVLTPVTIAIYTAGFLLLLPVFKKSFSTGFFWYVVISGCTFLLIFILLLSKQIKKEMKLLAYLIKTNMHLAQ